VEKTVDARDEVARLRGCLNDLLSIQALPALWTGREPSHIIGTVLAALLQILPAEFVFARLNDPAGGTGTPHETLQAATPELAPAIRAALDPWLADPSSIPSGQGRMVVDGDEFSLAFARLGLQGEYGLIVAGSGSPGGFGQTGHVVLNVAANQAVVALQTYHQSHSILDNIPGLVALLAARGEVEIVNRQLREYFGQTLEELRQWGTSGAVHPEDLPHVIEVFGRSIASEAPYEIVQRFRRRDGVYRWFLNSGSPLHDANGQLTHWCVLLTDIDDRKRAEDDLRASERNLQQIIDTIPAMAWAAATDGQAEFFNQHYLDFVGLTAGDARGWGWTSAVHPEDVGALAAIWQGVLASGTPGEAEARLRRRDGRYRWFLFRVNPLRDEHGVIVKWYGVNTDIEDRKLAQEARDRMRTELAHVTRAMSLGALTASIAHEVNQPLSGIITNASTCLRMLASDPPDVAGARETAKRTIRDGNRATAVVARLRALFSKREFTPELLDLNDVTREVIELLMSDLQRNGVLLQSELAADLPAVVGDRVQLQQVVLNLIRNASDAMSGVTDRPRQLTIITRHEEGGHVRLSVRDAGEGLDPQDVDKLFDAFYTTKSGGMGIGLSVSRSIVERHEGRLWAEPNAGPGATFSFSIPRERLGVTDAASIARTS
jgi:PAS domain S-box-containing protein